MTAESAGCESTAGSGHPRVPDLFVTGNIPVPPGIPLGPDPMAGIGVVVPYDMSLDRELWRWTPSDASLFLTRTPDELLPVTMEMVEKISDKELVRTTAQSLRSVHASCFAYACTSGSFVRGLGGERDIVDAMKSAGAPEAVTTSGAILEALAHLDIHRVAIATPYDEPITTRFEAFLNEAGIEVVGAAYLNLRLDIRVVPYYRTAELVRAADTAEAEAIVIACTNLPTYDLITPLEADIGKPVISANQATMWAALNRCGLGAVGPGQRLLAIAEALESDGISPPTGTLRAVE
ncbi:maleate cis-trans isomerase family protein [Spelaeicoccus albus]|uniref:Maleate isomerase n=1 Tax=Spelaeicoccus albus TaxID=1280376 RepID=A0A7Z0AAN8_9MICO|nr:aspartate/glutamate racemase family protein [Spelaeicoccus albus]NYI66645.1 maleate isomerase [Spelaeicoccus albus]